MSGSQSSNMTSPVKTCRTAKYNHFLSGNMWQHQQRKWQFTRWGYLELILWMTPGAFGPSPKANHSALQRFLWQKAKGKARQGTKIRSTQNIATNHCMELFFLDENSVFLLCLTWTCSASKSMDTSLTLRRRCRHKVAAPASKISEASEDEVSNSCKHLARFALVHLNDSAFEEWHQPI